MKVFKYESLVLVMSYIFALLSIVSLFNEIAESGTAPVLSWYWVKHGTTSSLLVIPLFFVSLCCVFSMLRAIRFRRMAHLICVSVIWFKAFYCYRVLSDSLYMSKEVLFIDRGWMASMNVTFIDGTTKYVSFNNVLSVDMPIMLMLAVCLVSGMFDR